MQRPPQVGLQAGLQPMVAPMGTIPSPFAAPFRMGTPGLIRPGMPVMTSAVPMGLRLPGGPMVPGIPVAAAGGMLATTPNAPGSGRPPRKDRDKAREAMEKGPTTTVFVGNITEKATDTLVRQMLMLCGHVVSWKRVQGASGKMQAFGFCEYSEPEAAVRALRLLNDLRLGEKRLLVKVDQKTRTALREHIKEKRKSAKAAAAAVLAGATQTNGEGQAPTTGDKEEGEQSSSEDEDIEQMPADDKEKELAEEIKRLVRDNVDILSDKDDPISRTVQESMIQMAKQSGKIDPDDNLDDMDMDADKKMIVTDEIKKFRHTYQKGDIKPSDKDRKSSKDQDRQSSSRRDETDKSRSRDSEKSRESRHDRDHDRSQRDKDKSSSRHERKDKDKERKDRKERDRSRERDRAREKDKDHDREKDRHRSERREKDRRRRDGVDSESSSDEQGSEAAPTQADDKRRTREVELDSRERRSHDRDRDRDRDRDHRRREPVEDSEDRAREREHAAEELAREMRRLKERKRRDREEAYQSRMRDWEARERQKAREYENVEADDDAKAEDMVRERKHLMDFLEDYEDDKDDSRYYTGSAFDRRLRQRKQEIEEDDRDRQRERDERKRRRTPSVSPDRSPPKRVKSSSRRSKSKPAKADVMDERMEVDSPQVQDAPVKQSGFKPIQVEAAPPVEKAPVPVRQPDAPALSSIMPEVSAAPLIKMEEAGKPIPAASVGVSTPPLNSTSTPEANQPMAAAPRKFGIVMKGGAANNVTSSAVPAGKAASKPAKPASMATAFFGDEDGQQSGPPKRTLVPIEYTEEEQRAVGRTNVMTAEQKKQAIKQLIERIPTVKEELFAFNLKWFLVDKDLVERRVRPWVTKKIVEFIGEEEPTLTDFICSKILDHSPPQAVLEDVSVVFDEEAEVFIVKMWRLLIYETEAKLIGLVK